MNRITGEPPPARHESCLTRAFASALLLPFTIVFAASCPTSAAEVTIPKQEGRVAIVEFSGPILKGDHKKFSDVIPRVPLILTVVVMEGPGGDLQAALEIGKEIKSSGYSTLVKSGRVCASACALVWLAGDERYMARGAKIGFHAAYAIEGNTFVEKGVANALIGAYLHSLELPEAAIRYITQASPNQVEWLTIIDAMHVGINLKVTGEKGD